MHSKPTLFLYWEALDLLTWRPYLDAVLCGCTIFLTNQRRNELSRFVMFLSKIKIVLLGVFKGRLCRICNITKHLVSSYNITKLHGLRFSGLFSFAACISPPPPHFYWGEQVDITFGSIIMCKMIGHEICLRMNRKKNVNTDYW